MLQYLIPILQNLAAVCIPLGLLLALAGQHPGPRPNWCWRGIALGCLGAILVAVIEWRTVLINREIYETAIQSTALVVETLLLLFSWLAYRRQDRGSMPGNLLALLLFLVPVLLILHRGPDVLLVPADGIRLATTSWASSDSWLQITGYLLGIGLAALAAVAVVRVARALPAGSVLVITTACLLTVMAQQAVSVVQVLLVRGVLPMKKWLMALMIPLINGVDWFFYALIVSVLLLPVWLVLLHRTAAQPPDQNLNPAQRRKLQATGRNKLRWGAVVGVNLVCILLLTSGGKAYINKQVELSPALPVTAVQNEIRLPLDQVGDDHLHRFAYTASNGTIVRFIVIKKSGSAYGVGLDACDICGPTGYYERDGQVICKLCDVVMNKATIGFSGGCNPVPLAYQVTGGNVVVAVEALEKEKNRF
ncbi:DUF2318 domain-containing protein|uniref:Uncharacterized membrane protein n=1 Tax=Dendrosporobacter quercicolus TaxID=146817 RepID=A0A1G9R081_9FIRM|nr:Fe-S-containing protein [Dendrosporobacter quercicolus]NSL48420.1 DUF2318 domain-containing protein [Dendrosporobacter quercicolus DSM 1736]SDM16267.1 Uncharacterized membrane protein [Dendrosporobacter quercicolus]